MPVEFYNCTTRAQRKLYVLARRDIHETLKFSVNFDAVFLCNNKEAKLFYACTVETYKIQVSDENVNVNNPYRLCWL